MVDDSSQRLPVSQRLRGKGSGVKSAVVKLQIRFLYRGRGLHGSGSLPGVASLPAGFQAVREIEYSPRGAPGQLNRCNTGRGVASAHPAVGKGAESAESDARKPLTPDAREP